MFAKLRCASGIVCRSLTVTIPCCTALAVSIGSVVIDDVCLTITVCCTGSGFIVIVKSRTELAKTVISARASANPAARTLTRYGPAGSKSTRNSPRSSPDALRTNEEPAASISILAPCTRAPLASSTTPRSVPVGFCAFASPVSRTPKANATRNIPDSETLTHRIRNG
jgi:hypothetical protein